MKIKYTAGVIITDRTKFLACLPFMNKDVIGKYDLPKGRPNDGELPSETAVREVREETGIVLDEKQLVFLGHFTYNREKDLKLYLYVMQSLPELSELVCTSMVSMENKEPFPEVKAYKYLSKTEIDYLFVKQAVILKSLSNKIFG